MIVLEKADLKSQEGMERAFQKYFAYVKQECNGTFNAMLGTRLHACDYEKKRLVLATEGQGWMTNPSDMLHGGVTASLLDMTMGLLCRYCSGGFMTPTISMSVNYLNPGPLGNTLYIQAEVTKCGFSVCHATGSMWAEGEEGRLIATASGAYYVTHRPD